MSKQEKFPGSMFLKEFARNLQTASNCKKSNKQEWFFKSHSVDFQHNENNFWGHFLMSGYRFYKTYILDTVNSQQFKYISHFQNRGIIISQQ